MHGIKKRVDRLFHRKMEANHPELVAPGTILSHFFLCYQITEYLLTLPKDFANLNDVDARELHRRELRQQYFSDLRAAEREAEIIKEDERIQNYDRSRADFLARDVNIPTGFQCEHAGCRAPPFQTQYLLKYELHHIDVQKGR